MRKLLNPVYNIQCKFFHHVKGILQVPTRKYLKYFHGAVPDHNIAVRQKDDAHESSMVIKPFGNLDWQQFTVTWETYYEIYALHHWIIWLLRLYVIHNRVDTNAMWSVLTIRKIVKLKQKSERVFVYTALIIKQ